MPKITKHGGPSYLPGQEPQERPGEQPERFAKLQEESDAVPEQEAVALGVRDAQEVRAEVGARQQAVQEPADGEDGRDGPETALDGAEDFDLIPYEDFTVQELRDELRGRELPTGGNKEALIARLEEDDEAAEEE